MTHNKPPLFRDWTIHWNAYKLRFSYLAVGIGCRADTGPRRSLYTVCPRAQTESDLRVLPEMQSPNFRSGPLTVIDRLDPCRRVGLYFLLELLAGNTCTYYDVCTLLTVDVFVTATVYGPLSCVCQVPVFG